MNNSSGTQPSSTAVVVIRTSFIALNALAIVLANVLNIIILRRAQVGSEPARVYISCLALADILVGVLAFCSTVPSGCDGFPFADSVCLVAGSFFATGLLLSVFFLACVSVDRFVAVATALRYECLVTRKLAIITVTLAWVSVFGIIITISLLDRGIMSYNSATFFCEPAFEDPDFPLTLFVLVILWITGGSFIMMVTYGHLFRVAHRHSRRIAAQELAATAASVHGARPRWSLVARKDMKAVWMCLTVTLAFNVAWVPTLCLDFYKFITKSKANSGVEFAITWISLSNSWWNFLIYSGMNKQFRDAAKQLLNQVWTRCRRRKVEGQSRELNLRAERSTRSEETRQQRDDNMSCAPVARPE